jgi:hypothetical protein
VRDEQSARVEDIVLAVLAVLAVRRVKTAIAPRVRILVTPIEPTNRGQR